MNAAAESLPKRTEPFLPETVVDKQPEQHSVEAMKFAALRRATIETQELVQLKKMDEKEREERLKEIRRALFGETVKLSHSYTENSIRAERRRALHELTHALTKEDIEAGVQNIPSSSEEVTPKAALIPEVGSNPELEAEWKERMQRRTRLKRAMQSATSSTSPPPPAE